MAFKSCITLQRPPRATVWCQVVYAYAIYGYDTINSHNIWVPVLVSKIQNLQHLHSLINNLQQTYFAPRYGINIVVYFFSTVLFSYVHEHNCL